MPNCSSPNVGLSYFLQDTNNTVKNPLPMFACPINLLQSKLRPESLAYGALMLHACEGKFDTHTRPDQRCQHAGKQRRLTRISIAVCTLVATPELSSAACKLKAFMQVASILQYQRSW